MSRPKPPPPPRPDLQEESFVEDAQTYYAQPNVAHCSESSSKPSKRVPPPIPLRPDLGEGIEDSIPAPSPPVPKIPPAVMEKKPRSSKSQGRPEITIISAQPMTTPGVISTPNLAPASFPSHPTPGLDMAIPIQPPPAAVPPAVAANMSTAVRPTTITPISPPPAQTQSKPITVSMQPQPVSSPLNIMDMESPPSQPEISSSRQAPLLSSKPNSPFSPSSSSTGSPLPNRVQRIPKNREPPQRPKSKPVCELPPSDEDFSGNVGIMSACMDADNQGDSPIAPKRKKNKPNKNKAADFDSGFGINNSAFFENEGSEQDVNIINKEVTEPPSTKAKGFPTVIRTKPNGKDNASFKQEQLQPDKTENATKVKTAKPTVIKPPPAAKKPPKQQHENTDIPPQTPVQPEPVTKPKSKPTLIIPKGKKDSANKNESIEERLEETKLISPPEKQVLESQKEDVEDKKPSKTKRIPNIIRPNRLKKDPGSPQGDTAEGFRGTPEGECSQSQTKKGPVRRAPPPPRPGPPRAAPPRPGPPKKAAPEEPRASVEASSFSVKFEARPTAPAPTETKAAKSEHVKQSRAPEAKHRAKHSRPAPIGKDKESTEHKNIERKEKTEGKKPDEPVLSSVVSTKIEPSAIALYDYVPTSIEDLSFKAGDEIFLVKRINHEWYIGQCGDNEGMMPVKFVEIIEDLPHEPDEPSTSHKPLLHTHTLLSTVALYHFEAQSSDELSFHAGDTIHLLEMVNDEWLKGQSSGKVGIFPTNFVEFDEDMKHKLQQKATSNPQAKFTRKSSIVSSGPRCKAMYDYNTDNPDDLSFNTGDMICITKRINAEWLKGEIRGEKGMFPVAYVEIIEDIPLQETAVKHALPVTTALHDYISPEAGDLSFRKGDRITVIKKINADWLEGKMNGQTGMLPSAYVQPVDMSGSTLHQKVSGHKVQPEGHLLPKGRALYDFSAELDSELSFKAGDEIILLRKMNEEWMEGELNNDIGQFPSAFIEILVPLP